MMNLALPIRLVVADDHAVVRAGLRTLIDRQSDMEIVGEASTAGKSPAVMIIDLKMPGGGAIEAIRRIRHRDAAPEVVVFTAFDDPADAQIAFRAGACAFVVKRAPGEELLRAIRSASKGERYVDPAVGGEMMERLAAPASTPPSSNPRLSNRERQVVELVARGFSNKEIAERYALSIKSVETYRARVSGKLGLSSRSDLVQYALRSGLLDRDNRLDRDEED